MTEYVIIGDGISGSSAAETLREEDPESEITVITDEGEPLYNRILIKEHAKGKLPEAPISIHDEAWYEERDIDLSLDTHVTSVDTDAHVVHTHEGEEIGYDKLLVATGGTPTQLPVENSDADGIHHFWTFQDARAIRESAEAADKGVVVGAGLLGIDFAAVCGSQDVEGKYLMRGDCWWRYALSEDGAEIVHDGLREMGVEPVLNSGVDRFETDDDGCVTAAVDPNGERYGCDFAGVAIGLSFNTEFLRGTDIERDDGIFVDEYMQTTVEDVYAAGDITRFHDVLLGERAQNGSWGSAKEQGRVAAVNMAADDETEVFEWVSSYSITHFEFPFLSFGHPTLGDEHAERKYSDTEWRRIAFKDGKIIGGVLIGDLSPQSKFKQLMREQREVTDQTEVLLEQSVDLDELAPTQEK
ncbi:NAD(P)/FAD-dependent oxidoreductase [Natronobacterium gregoryi]|uniref:FAD-dependent pyridine nucleotide-disulfide oxidoreductase n=2 Tax=Natronobacterium gregoryi TaxID=44930 RepID=L0AJS4_NATGS|nr:FAD-dependent oxidoreductase [Natronobacterium gregoryi]AFZ73305.1 NAD(P)H-nitrite reductase [Natronobacterium gregoryi SP2]ELY73950.1 FAD-dependent pyridine nucleotide-disulfide oxidoreductase [Natronobacterium gregoryi SP2]PLK19902.1 NAD(P)/FAD-dependent oxidoreductase [Natronobacterium gregoryi SP2]SFJ37744.1 Pyridine nucleotide-disulphide oxidoreductase [Natronobacterium gregoryi]